MTRFKLPIAVHVFLLRSGCVLLLQRQNTGFQDGNCGIRLMHYPAIQSRLSAVPLHSNL
jgi:hypothetical protein